MIQIKLPQLGENIEGGEIVNVLVSKGDSISKDQAIIEVETDKSVTEVPSSYSGKITKILVSKGDEIKSGEVILEIEGDDSKNLEDEKAEDKEEKKIENDKKEKEVKNEKEQADDGNDEDKSDQDKEEQDVQKSSSTVKTSPSVRKLAYELDVDLDKVKSSSSDGKITKEDIEKHSKSSKSEDKNQDIESDLEYTSQKLSNLRRKTALVMNEAWTNTPMVTHFEEVEINELLSAKKTHSKSKKITMSAIFLNALSITLMEFKKFNAVIDLENDQIQYYPKHNLGIAVDTDYGLVVPVISDVYGKNIFEINDELLQLSEKAKNRKLAKEDISNGTFTLTNLGSIGTGFFTPIIYPGQSAILGIGKTKEVLGLEDEELIMRKMLPLSLTYDHRLIDGADAARFLNRFMELLLEPKKLNWNG
jgi:pyruvate dehydrogenase E2 component (dihydrolipoamide acetyltransferase)